MTPTPCEDGSGLFVRDGLSNAHISRTLADETGPRLFLCNHGLVDLDRQVSGRQLQGSTFLDQRTTRGSVCRSMESSSMMWCTRGARISLNHRASLAERP